MSKVKEYVYPFQNIKLVKQQLVGCGSIEVEWGSHVKKERKGDDHPVDNFHR